LLAEQSAVLRKEIRVDLREKSHGVSFSAPGAAPKWIPAVSLPLTAIRNCEAPDQTLIGFKNEHGSSVAPTLLRRFS
jgi:hypothetical protein